MSWRERLPLDQASFRGVEFYVKKGDTQIGRRTAIHEYPQRDDAWPEDMGRLARRFTIEALVTGDDYDQWRDELITALEEPGPGELVHPYYGRRQVSLASPARISESATDEGGIARFSLEFIEAGDNTEPSARVDTADAVDAAADDAEAACLDDFCVEFSLDGLPDFADLSAMSQVQGLIDDLAAIRSGMLPDMSVLTDFLSAGKLLSGGLASILRAPVDLANRILGLVAGVRGLATAPLAAIAALRKLFGWGKAESAARPVPLTTPSRRAQARNVAAVNSLVQRAAVIQAVRASARVEFTTYDQAVALRDELVDALDTVADVAPDTVYPSLVALRSALVRDVAARGASLARLGTTVLPGTLPALVVAHRVYGDATRDGDIIDRNPAIRHPGFVPGGVTLEILRV